MNLDDYIANHVTDRFWDVTILLTEVLLILWPIIRAGWKERRTGDPMGLEPEYDERQRLVQMRASWLALQVVELYLLGCLVLSVLNQTLWINNAMLVAGFGVCLSALTYRGYCELHDATQDADRRKFPTKAVILAASNCIWAAAQWIWQANEVKLWESRVQIYGEAEIGPRPSMLDADSFVWLLTVLAAGLTILAVIALWRWLRERYRRTEEA